MKITVVGAGAMGTLFGGRLARDRHDVCFIDADPDRVAAIDAAGVSEDGKQVLCKATLPGSSATSADLLIIFTKTNHTARAIEANARVLAPDGVVLTLQNGLGNDAIIADVVGEHRVLVGVTNWPADLLDHGKITVGGEGTVSLWALDDATAPVAHQVAGALDRAGLNASADPSVRIKIWEKVIFNAALNSTAALTGLTVGGIADVDAVRVLADDLVEEGIAIALASGVAIDPAQVRTNVAFALANHRAHKPSMLQDVAARRTTEVDAILGRLVVAAAAVRLSAPCLATCAALLRGVDARHLQGKN